MTATRAERFCQHNVDPTMQAIAPSGSLVYGPHQMSISNHIFSRIDLKSACDNFVLCFKNGGLLCLSQLGHLLGSCGSAGLAGRLRSLRMESSLLVQEMMQVDPKAAVELEDGKWRLALRLR